MPSPSRRGSGDIWSPYYRITTYRDAAGEMVINVNGIPHQALHPLVATKEQFYDQVYRLVPRSDLRRRPDRRRRQRLGRGHRPGPRRRARGRRRDRPARSSSSASTTIPNHPYDDPRVTRIDNDGRAFLRDTDKQYDLVIFALPDSLTLVSTTANIRLESFLFTDEAFASVRDHLTPGGIFVLYNYYREQWLIEKLADMLA